MAGRLRVQAARQQHGAGKGLRRVQIGQRQLSLPELAVKRRVVRHHGRAADKARSVAHHAGRVGGSGHHGVGDAGELRDEGRNPGAGPHQALKAVHHLAALQQHDGHFGGACAAAGRHAGGFKVDDGNGRGHHKVQGKGQRTRPPNHATAARRPSTRPQRTAGCSRKNRSISRVASTPRASVWLPLGWPPDQACPAPCNNQCSATTPSAARYTVCVNG